MPESPVFVHTLAVRFSDCDMLGHVNHAVYFTYMEEARLAWWRHLGAADGFPGAGTVVVHAECDYRAPAFINQPLSIHLTLARLGQSSVTLLYRIVHAESGALVAEGKTVSVTVDRQAGTTVPIPAASRALLEGTARIHL